MLVISRQVGEVIHIGDDITLTVTQVQGGRVRLGIVAPTSIPVYRGEVYARIKGREHDPDTPQADG